MLSLFSLSNLKKLVLVFILLFDVLIALQITYADPGGVSDNLTFWLDADNDSSLFQDSCGGTASSSDGDRIGCWQDLSGNSHDFTASGNIRPTLRTGTKAINFNPSLDFDGSEDFLEDADGESYINGISEFSTFVVVDSDVAGADRYVFNSESDLSGAEAPWGLRFDDAGALSGKDDTIKTGIDTGTEVLYEGNESNIVNANPLLASIHWTSGEAVTLSIDGRNIPVHPATASNGTLSNADYTRIGHEGGHSFWQGTIAELILYQRKINTTEKQKVESYLAIKYGITLHTSLDYLDSSGNTIYASTSTHVNYTNNIAGIGRDDTSSLNQTRSKSIHSGNIVDISNATGIGDREFLVWGHDNGPLTTTSTNTPAGKDMLQRTWRLDQTGDVGTIDLIMNISSMNLSSTNKSHLFLIKNTNINFTSVSGIVANYSDSSTVTFQDVDFNGDDFFTLAVLDTDSPTISYASPTQPNGTSLVRDYIEVNVSVTDDHFSNLTYRLYNSTFSLINKTVLASISLINFTGVAEGTYHYNATACDQNNLCNTTAARTIILDQIPSVTDISPSDQTYNTSEAITINATIIDNSVDTALANITYPNSTVTQLTLVQVSGNLYSANFTIPSLAGIYNISVSVNDSAGNLNNTESAVFLVSLGDPNDINSILAWYDGADNTSLFTDSSCSNPVTADNQEVFCWENKAGGSNATVVSGKGAAKYRSAAQEKISSSTTLRFNKSNETVYETGIDIRANTTEDITLFAVYRPRTNDTSDQGQAIWGNDDGSWDRFYYSLFSYNAGLGTDGVDDGLISLGGASSGLSIDGAGTVDSVFLLTAVYDGNVSGGTNSGPVNGSQIYFDGDLKTRFTDESHATAAQTQMFIGRDGDNGYYDGDISEIIVYDRILTPCQIDIINNYLGGKYGKDFSGISEGYGFSSPHDNNINGISEYLGNCSVSTEVTSAQSSIATISDPGSLDLNDSLTFAHDNLGFSLISDVPGNYTRRISQSWRVDVDNSPGNVSISFDLSTTDIIIAGTLALLIDNDTNFSDSAAHTTGYSVSGNIITFTSVNFSNGNYFTLGLDEPAPQISFVDPTLSNGSLHPQNNFIINVTSNSSEPDHYTFTDFDNELVFWMRMDDTNGSGDPVDISDGNNGSLTGNALINDTGKFGKAVHLDGSGDYISLPASDIFIPDKDSWSISVWLNADSIGSGNFANRIITFRNSSTLSAVSLTLGQTDQLQFFYRDSSGTGTTTDIRAISTQTWYHYVATYNGSTYNIYVDGVLNASIADSMSGVSSDNGRIGVNPDGSSEYFNGSIDEMLIFNRPLSAAEILFLYNASANQYVNNFSDLADGDHTFISYAVAASGQKNQTELRTVTIDTTPPLISYGTGTQDNNTIISQNFVYINVSITETNEANITFRLFNSTFGLLNETTYTTAQRSINFTGLSDAAYYYNVTVMDLAGNSNTTDSRNITLDTTNPGVTGLYPSGQTFNTSHVLQINATVTDTHLDTVIANITFPNNTIQQVTLANIAGDIYSANFTIPVLAGKYNITIIANDTAANINSSVSSVFTAELKDPSDIGNLRVWYDATDNSTLYTDESCSTAVTSENQEVLCWQDKSSYGHNATNVSGKGAPEYITDQFNGLSVLNFSKSAGDTLRHELASQYTSDFTIFTVIQSRDTSPSLYDSFFSNGEPAHVDHFQIDYTDSGNAFRYGASTKFNFENFSNEIKLYSVTHDGNNVVLYNEGQQANSGNTTEGRVFEHYRINQNRAGNQHHNSKIAEIIIYDRVLTTCELEMVDIYLGDKYGRDFFGVEDNYGFPAPHNNDINGIGQFPGNCSATVDISSAVISFVTISAPTSLDLNDSLTVAHNNGGISISTDAPVNYSRMNQSWRADKDDGGNGDGDSVGLVTVAFDISDNLTIADYDSFVLLIDDDGTFDNATIESTGTKTGNTVSFTDINFTNGDYFTLGFTDTTAPAVTALNITPGSSLNTTASFEIDANITDLIGVSAVIANITLPNGSISQITLTNSGGDNFDNTYAAPGLIGTYTVRIIANDTTGNINSSETTTFAVQNDVPDPSDVSINSGSDITLSSGTNTTVIGSATITDLNGFADISNATGYLFLTTSGADADDNNSDHYTAACTDNSDGTGNTISYNCTFNVSHYAIPTDAGSNSSFTNWTFLISPQDSQGTGTNGSATTELNTLSAFTIDPSIVNFGEIALGANTTNLNQEINVTNLGNSGLDVLLSGTNLSCNTSSIEVTFLEYGGNPFTYGSGTDLSESNVELDLDSVPGTETDPTPKKTTYYGLGIPAIAVGGSCSGSIIITGQSDPHND